MNNPFETIAVATIIVLAGAYLTRRYLLKRRKTAAGSSSCGGSCGCAATKPGLQKR